MMHIGIQSKCEECNKGNRPFRSKHSGQMVHGHFLCLNYDAELRHIGEAFGFFIFSWIPRKCRNDRWRWLTWLERHGGDGSYTYTLGNRGH